MNKRTMVDIMVLEEPQSAFFFFFHLSRLFRFTHVTPPATTQATDPARDSHTNDSVPPPDPCYLCMTSIVYQDY